MNKSPPGNEYDPHLEFAQFLKEAKTHACQKKPLHDASGKKQLNGTAKPNRSWKSSIFTWLRADKKSCNKKSNELIIEAEQPPCSKSSHKTRQGYVSGPVNRISAERPKRPNSGPLLSALFKTKEEEFQMPYISLGKFSNSRDVKPYGPVYMVT